MTETVNFALRLPSDLKAAAEALKNISVERPSRNGRAGHMKGVYIRSTNDAIGFLILEGLEPARAYVQKALDEATRKFEGWQDILNFLSKNPTERAKTDDFAEDSAARSEIDYWQDYGGTEEAPVGKGIDLEHTMRGYAAQHREVLNLTRAQAAIANVLEPLEAEAKRSMEERLAMLKKERADRQAERKRVERKRPGLTVV